MLDLPCSYKSHIYGNDTFIKIFHVCEGCVSGEKSRVSVKYSSDTFQAAAKKSVRRLKLPQKPWNLALPVAAPHQVACRGRLPLFAGVFALCILLRCYISVPSSPALTRFRPCQEGREGSRTTRLFGGVFPSPRFSSKARPGSLPVRRISTEGGGGHGCAEDTGAGETVHSAPRHPGLVSRRCDFLN